MKRITKAVLGGLGGCGLILGATQAATGEAPVGYSIGSSEVVNYDYDSKDLVDLQLTTDGPFDGASATLKIKESAEDFSSDFKFQVSDIKSSAGTEFGAHLHTGECVKGAGALAGPHYNAGGGISEETEVWFSLVPNEKGVATSSAEVPFVPKDSLSTDKTLPLPNPGIMSIVIHVAPTNPVDGSASFRQACFPLEVPQWANE